MMREDYIHFCKVVESDDILCVNRFYNRGGEMYIKVKLIDSDVFWVDIFLFERITVSTSNEINEKWETALKLSEKYQCRIRDIIIEQHLSGDWSYPHKSALIDNVVAPYEDNILNELNSSCYGGIEYICRSPFTPRWILNQRMYMYRVEDFLPLENDCVVFEDDVYSAMKDYELFLKMDYGDYMSFPKKLIVQHSYEQKNSDFEANHIIKKYNIG